MSDDIVTAAAVMPFEPCDFEALQPEARAEYLDCLSPHHPIFLLGALNGCDRASTIERLLSIAARNQGN